MDALRQIDEWNGRFAIPRMAELVAGNGGLPKVRVTAGGSAAEVYLHGAQVNSWKPAGGDDVIFVSEHSRWEDGRAIRGGIPICFPWFRGKADDATAPAHGFVRTRQWKLASVDAHEDRSVTLVFATESDASTRRWWPHDFRLQHRVTVGKTLRLELIATNTGADRFRFEEALHTYFQVGDVRRASVRGLAQVAYLDNMDSNREKMQSGEVVLAGPTDNAYLNTRGAVEMMDGVTGRLVRTAKENSATTIVWNPWEKGAAALADLGDDEWKQMICVEASNILDASVSLDPGQEHAMRATLSIVGA